MGKRSEGKPVGAKNLPPVSIESPEKKVPQSFVIRTGPLKSATLQELVLNVRKCMEPHTALKLKERRKNKLKDYISVAGNLGVTHMLLFSQTLMHTVLRMAHFPRGPTLYFNVEEYSLMKDVHHYQKQPFSLGGIEYKSPPLVVLDGFETVPQFDSHASGVRHPGAKEIKLLTVFLQNMFPAINIPTMKVSSAKRVLLFALERDGFIYLRHYVISLKPQCKDATPENASIMDNSNTTANNNSRTKILKDLVNDETLQKAVSVHEVGPRMKLELVKILDAFNEGKILYQKYHDDDHDNDDDDDDPDAFESDDDQEEP